jgi:hypothetical protein
VTAVTLGPGGVRSTAPAAADKSGNLSPRPPLSLYHDPTDLHFAGRGQPGQHRFFIRPTESAKPLTYGILQAHATLRAGYKSGKAKSIRYRKHQLLQLAYLLQDNREKFNDAIKNDLGRSSLENEMYVSSRQAFAKQLNPHSRLEIFLSLAEVKQSFDNVEKWAKPESAPLSLYSLTSPKIRKEAKGVILIFVPYNYPILLLMSPIVGVITRVRYPSILICS